MRKLFSIIAAILFAGSMMAAVQEFSVTITTANLVTGGYAANNTEKTITAVATADPTVTLDVKWTSNQIMIGTGDNAGKIQGKKAEGVIYNAASWGSVKSITINDASGSGYTYVIGSQAQPTTAVADGGFFKISAGSASAAYCSSIVIVFEADPAVASLSISLATSSGTKSAWAVSFNLSASAMMV